MRLVLLKSDVRREIYTETRGQCGLRKATLMLWSPTNTKTGAQDGALKDRQRNEVNYNAVCSRVDSSFDEHWEN